MSDTGPGTVIRPTGASSNPSAGDAHRALWGYSRVGDPSPMAPWRQTAPIAVPGSGIALVRLPLSRRFPRSTAVVGNGIAQPAAGAGGRGQPRSTAGPSAARHPRCQVTLDESGPEALAPPTNSVSAVIFYGRIQMLAWIPAVTQRTCAGPAVGALEVPIARTILQAPVPRSELSGCRNTDYSKSRHQAGS
ncbi:hypothetical protein DSL92_01955 [Billgrantia gudaonensis]|uniref:Uncharacterized protein n=1 Tax=Billgrantia gudaonensis TaxID=376427 RepID=A0A432JLQ7_9GAMM|nr:hypothetical protein DSL92_01955 [Halomonas gudaonensis]